GTGLIDQEAGILELERLPADQALPSWSKARWLADALPPRELANMPDVDPAAEVLIAAGINHRRGGLPWFLAAAGHLERARSMAEQFVTLADGVPSGILVISATGHAYFGLGLAHAALGHPDDATRAFSRAREIYDRINHHAVIGFTLLSELQDVLLPYHADRIEERRRMTEAAETALNRAGGAFPSDRYALRARLMLHFLDGRWDEAAAIADATPEQATFALRRTITNALAPIWFYRGDDERLHEHIHALLPQGPSAAPGGIVYLDGLLLQRLAAAQAIDRGDLVTAAAWLEANNHWLDWNGSVLGRAENQIAWSRYFRACEDLPRAVAFAERAVEYASEPRQPLALLAALRTRGEQYIELGVVDLAADDVMTARVLADACAAPLERALTLLSMASFHRATNQPAAGEADLTTARDICTALRAHRALSWIARLGGSPREPEPKMEAVPVAGLTPREVEVLRLVSQGMTDAQVAGILFISPRTVGQHLRSIYAKLDVSTRAAATRIAVERGLG
ncbi:MAG TPA: LuxR C-terminal-related transcriptional regulator, partial [Thermomicrobiales bacterium]|nr:LuxR C-terminal-related transcriptional regulator [Thermomicrobiales bacterium]